MKRRRPRSSRRHASFGPVVRDKGGGERRLLARKREALGPTPCETGQAMQVEDTAIPEVKIVTPKKHGDARGFFSEVFNKSAFAALGLDLEFVQDNHSFSAAAGTLRGLHFQIPPFAQDKLIRVGRGRILDVAVDIRRSSPTFGRHVAVELSAGNWRQLLIPAASPTASSPWSRMSRCFTRRRPIIRPPTTAAFPGTIPTSGWTGRCLKAGRSSLTRTGGGRGSGTPRTSSRDPHRRHRI